MRLSSLVLSSTDEYIDVCNQMGVSIGEMQKQLNSATLSTRQCTDEVKLNFSFSPEDQKNFMTAVSCVTVTMLIDLEHKQPVGDLPSHISSAIPH